MINTDGSINFKIDMLLKLSNPSIVAFINEIDKKVWITSKNSALACIEANTKLLNIGFHSIRGLNEDRNKLEVVILEQHNNVKYLKYMVNKWYTKYLDMGYTEYENECRRFDYTFYTRFEYRQEGNTPASLYIAGKSRSISTMILLGRFKTMLELEEFKKKGIELCLKELV